MTKKRIVLEHMGERFLFDSIESVEKYLASQVETANDEDSKLLKAVIIQQGKPVIKAKPKLVKAISNDAETNERIIEVNKAIQSEHDRRRSMMLSIAVQQIQEEEEMLLLLMAA